MTFKLYRKITALISLELYFEENMNIIRDRYKATSNTTTSTIEIHRMKFNLKKCWEKERKNGCQKIQNGSHEIYLVKIYFSDFWENDSTQRTKMFIVVSLTGGGNFGSIEKHMCELRQRKTKQKESIKTVKFVFLKFK